MCVRVRMWVFVSACVVCMYIYMYLWICMVNVFIRMFLQPRADRMAQNLEIIAINFQSSTRRTRILMGFIISTILLHNTNRKIP